MGLDIGIMSVEYLERPRGITYEFAWGLAAEANIRGYMGGGSNSWGPFTKGEVRLMLDGFAERRDLTQDQIVEVQAWVESLPWEGDGIELHFNW